MIQLPFQYQPHQFLCRRAHITKPLSKGNHVESIVLQCLNHHSRIPAVVGNLPDVELLPQLQNKLLDESVMHDISFCRMDEALTLPFVIHHMIPADAQL